MTKRFSIDPARVPNEMQDMVVTALSRIEMDQGLRVLFAVESGSRAWGFHSPDSDFDVRFVYIRPRDWYLSIDQRRDVYEGFNALAQGTIYEGKDLDIVGWDLIKALHLMRKSNPQLLEWLNGPALYYAYNAEFLQDLRKLSNTVLQLGPVHAHYMGMAIGNFREYLQGDMVRFKKYLYVLRPLLAAQYVRNELEIPPVDFNELCTATLSAHSQEFRDSLARLLEFKKSSPEVREAPRDPVLNEWIEQQLAIRWEAPVQIRMNQQETTALLDQRFHSALNRFTHTIAKA